jgi:pimeloyl-ACP methyl ester carboxylesterase
VNPLGGLSRRAGLLGAGAGVIAVGAAIGLAAERYAVGRSFRGLDAERGEPFGQLRGTPVPVTTDDGVPLCVEVDEAPGAGPVTIVFCHGYALSQDAFHYQRRDLGDLGRLVFWDQRGHGRSGRGDLAHATIDQLGADLLRVLDAVAPTGPIVLVGHSMGGMTVMALADAHPELFGERVIGVALISTSPGKLTDAFLGVPAYLGRVLGRVAPTVVGAVGLRPDIVDRGRRMGSDLTYVLTKRYAFASQAPPSMVEFTARMNAAVPADVLAELFPAFTAHDKLAALDVLNGVETLIMAGGRDLLTPAEHSADMLRRVPGAELMVVEDAGHMLILEHYGLVNDELRAMVGRAVRSWRAAS